MDEPYVRIVEQPARSAVRFRYECEGRSAGPIPGVGSTPSLATYPTIQLVNYLGQRSMVVVSCVTVSQPYRQHPHHLVGRVGCHNGVCTMIIDNPEHLCSFTHLGIQCAKRNEIASRLKLRKQLQIDPTYGQFEHITKSSRSLDLGAIRLCFQVYIEDPQTRKFTRPLKPVISDPVYDKKLLPKLIITDISNTACRVTGGKVMLFCNYIDEEDIEVRFYELDSVRGGQGTVVWEATADLKPPMGEVHKRVGISLLAPAYARPDIIRPVNVFLELRRPSDQRTSEPIAFTYLPECQLQDQCPFRHYNRVPPPPTIMATTAATNTTTIANNNSNQLSTTTTTTTPTSKASTGLTSSLSTNTGGADTKLNQHYNTSHQSLVSSKRCRQSSTTTTSARQLSLSPCGLSSVTTGALRNNTNTTNNHNNHNNKRRPKSLDNLIMNVGVGDDDSDDELMDDMVVVADEDISNDMMIGSQQHQHHNSLQLTGPMFSTGMFATNPQLMDINNNSNNTNSTVCYVKQLQQHHQDMNNNFVNIKCEPNDISSPTNTDDDGCPLINTTTTTSSTTTTTTTTSTTVDDNHNNNNSGQSSNDLLMECLKTIDMDSLAAIQLQDSCGGVDDGLHNSNNSGNTGSNGSHIYVGGGGVGDDDIVDVDDDDDDDDDWTASLTAGSGGGGTGSYLYAANNNNYDYSSLGGVGGNTNDNNNNIIGYHHNSTDIMSITNPGLTRSTSSSHMIGYHHHHQQQQQQHPHQQQQHQSLSIGSVNGDISSGNSQHHPHHQYHHHHQQQLHHSQHHHYQQHQSQQQQSDQKLSFIDL